MNKKITLGLGVLASASLPILAVVACSHTSETEKQDKIKSKWDMAPAFSGTKVANKKLGFVVADPENPRWQKSKAFLETNGKVAFGGVSGAIIKSSNEQSEWIKANANKMDVLIIGAKDQAVAGAWQTWPATKPVIAFDRLVKTNTRTAYNWYVTFDNSLVGRMQGIAILNHIYDKQWTVADEDADIKTYIGSNKLTSKKVILSLAGAPTDNNAELFFNGAKTVLKLASTADSNFVFGTPYDNFSSVAQANWDYAKGQSFLKAKIDTMSDGDRNAIAAVLSPNDGMAQAAIQALKLAKLDPMSVYITGQDSNDEAIFSIAGKKKAGQDMTIAKPDSLATAVTVGLAKKILENTAKYNVAPASLQSVDKDAILAAIRADFPGIEFKYDNTQYETKSGAPINTIILTPQIVSKANIGTGKLFEIVKE